MTSRHHRRAYDSWHTPLDVDRGSDAPWHELVKRHLDAPRDLAGKRILEIGCGRGGFACWLARHVARPMTVVAADFSPVAVRRGRAFAAEAQVEGITWEVSNIQTLAHPDESFDTLISCETIEHVPKPAEAIVELARVLKPGGRLLLTTPNYFSTLGLYRMYLRLRRRRYTEEGQPINQLTMLPRVRIWVSRAGLHVVSTHGVGHYLPIPRRPPRRLFALDRVGRWMRWVALHTLIVAEKA